MNRFDKFDHFMATAIPAAVCFTVTCLLVMLILCGCSRETWRAPMVVANDTVPMLPGLQAKKITFTGPVTFTTQSGTGHTATSAATDNRKAGQRQGSAATGAGSVAGNEQAGTPWLLYGLLLTGGAALGFWGRGKLPGLSNLLDR